MKFNDLFYSSLINALENGSIGFSEPDLTKVFVNLLSISFSSGVISSGKLTQSQQKWFASRTKNGPSKEIGDFILFSKKNKEFKMAFVQAKTLKKPNSSLDSVRGNVFQHWLMCGKAENIYLMGKTPFTFFSNSKSKKSISNYLVFYRFIDPHLGFYKYEAFLSAVRYGTKLCKTSEKTLKEFHKNGCRAKLQEKPITFGRKYENYHLSDDCICATTFREILKEIAAFRVGEKVNSDIIKALSPYVSPKVIHILKTGEMCVTDNDNSNGTLPVIIIDADSYNSEVEIIN